MLRQFHNWIRSIMIRTSFLLGRKTTSGSNSCGENYYKFPGNRYKVIEVEPVVVWFIGHDLLGCGIVENLI